MDQIILTDEQNEVFNNVLESVKNKNVTTLGGFAGTGKANANSSLVYTPFGGKSMGDICIGDQVSNPDGSVARVIAVHPQGKKQIYKVSFIDGRSTRVTEDHLWLFSMSSKKYKANRKYLNEPSNKKVSYEINTTKFLIDYLNQEKIKKRPSWPLIPLTKPTQFTIIGNNERLSIDPYLLGLLLGDGSLARNSLVFTSADAELLNAFTDKGYVLNKCNDYNYDYRLVGEKSIKLRKNLKDFELLGTKSDTKFIPKDYLFSSIENRFRIIQGLMDTDGGLDKTGTCEYSSVSERLAHDVQWIIRSLGGKATIKTKIGKYRSKKTKKIILCKKVYRMYIQFENKELLFNLKRKKENSKSFNGGNSILKNRMISIEKDGIEDATCIQVDHPNSLYLTDDFIVTHNTSLVQQLIEKLPNWKVAAFTGKAANVLRKKGIENASTIHSAIYVPKMDYDGNIILDKNGSPTFILNPTLECDGFIIDEASMVPEDIQKDLLSFNVPILYVGDHGQLPPIGTDTYLMKEPDFRLEKIHRNAGEIAIFCEFIRRGYEPTSFSKYAKNSVKFITKKQAETKWKDADQIICGFNKTRVDINKNIRKQLGFTSNWPQIGDKIMCLKNDNQAKLFNGMQGYVKFLSSKQKNKLTFQSDNVNYDIVFDPDQFNKEKVESFGRKDDPMPMDYCYGATCHKCQGDEFDVGYVLEQKCKFWCPVRWGYTAASRFKKEVNWIKQIY